jgi:hypothetical protein
VLERGPETRGSETREVLEGDKRSGTEGQGEVWKGFGGDAVRRHRKMYTEARRSVPVRRCIGR